VGNSRENIGKTLGVSPSQRKDDVAKKRRRDARGRIVDRGVVNPKEVVDKLVEENLGLVRKQVFSSYSRRGLITPTPIEDTEEYSVGCCKLFLAAKKYDECEAAFSTYATHYIYWGIRDYLATDGVVVIPNYHGRKLSETKKLCFSLSDAVGEVYGVGDTASPYAKGKNFEDYYLADYTDQDDIESKEAFDHLKRRVCRVVSDRRGHTPLHHRKKVNVLIRNEVDDISLTDIAKKRGICKERARQYKTEAINSIRMRFSEVDFLQYLDDDVADVDRYAKEVTVKGRKNRKLVEMERE